MSSHTKQKKAAMASFPPQQEMVRLATPTGGYDPSKPIGMDNYDKTHGEYDITPWNCEMCVTMKYKIALGKDETTRIIVNEGCCGEKSNEVLARPYAQLGSVDVSMVRFWTAPHSVFISTFSSFLTPPPASTTTAAAGVPRVGWSRQTAGISRLLETPETAVTLRTRKWSRR